MRHLLKLTWLALVLGALAACASQPTVPATMITSLPTPTMRAPTPTLKEVPTAIPATEVIINENVQRTSLFSINTLAYELPGMDDVEVVNITYAYSDEKPLTMDVYYPPGTPAGTQLPVVIFGLGYRMSQEPLRNAHFYTSWGKLVAAAGMAAIAYDTERPDVDLGILIAFIRANAADLRIDLTRIGLMSSSANSATVMSYLMQEGREGFKFSIYYFGFSLTPDRKYREVLAESCTGRGCLVTELSEVTYVDPKIPLFVVKAGRDHIPYINEAMDHFVDYVQDAGAPVTYIVYEEGEHGFDTRQKTDESAKIIAQTLAFMKAGFGID